MKVVSLGLTLWCLLVVSVSARLRKHLQGSSQILVLSPLLAEDVKSIDADRITWARAAQNGSTLVLAMVHRDSIFLPFNNQSRLNRVHEALTRDGLRMEALSRHISMAVNGVRLSKTVSSSSPVFLGKNAIAAGFTTPTISGLNQGSGEYFIRLGVGTPSKLTYMVADTGSDVLWLQCMPCLDCYKQVDPIFNPLASSSFQRLPCASPMCRMLELHSCSGESNTCLYQLAYGDGSFTTGDFSMETLSFDAASIANVGIGCGHDNEGLFAGASGLFGLGGGSLSFPSQMGKKVFSYCLVPRLKQNSISTLVFGAAAVPNTTVFTPLLKNPAVATYYYVSLAGISVGGGLVSIPASAFQMDSNGNGGVIIDSGTSVTRLVEVAYGPLRSAFRAAARGLSFVGGVSLFDTCYGLGDGLAGAASLGLPSIVLHFQGGADMVLPAANYLVPVDSKGTYCLAFASTPGALSIIGNIQQQGFRIVFDGAASRLGFAANQC